MLRFDPILPAAKKQGNVLRQPRNFYCLSLMEMGKSVIIKKMVKDS